MPHFRIPDPKTKKWQGVFPGKYAGNLWQTFNINLEKSKGRLRLGDRLQILTDSSDVASLGAIKKFIRTNSDRTDRYWCASSTAMLKTAGSNPYVSFAADALTATPTSGIVDADVHERMKVGITSSTDATPVVVTTSANHNLLNGDVVEIIGHLTNVSINRLVKVANKTATTFECTDPDTGANIAGSGAGAGSAGNVFFVQRLVVSLTNDLAMLARTDPATWDATWWTVTLAQPRLLTSIYHPLAHLGRQMAIGDVNKIHVVDQNDVVTNAILTFQYGYEARVILANKDRFWIGLQNNFANRAKIVEWDGGLPSSTKEYELLGSCPVTGFVIKNIPYFIDEFGYLYRFNGNGFVPIQQFPMAEEKAVFDFSETSNQGGIWSNGAIAYDDLAYILVNAPVSASNNNISKRMRSGIWVYDSITNNLYHSLGIGQYKSSGTDKDYGQSPVSRVGAIYVIPNFTTQIPTTALLSGAQIYTNYGSGTTKQAIYQVIPNENQNSNAGRNRGYFITPYLPQSEIDALWYGLWLKFRKLLNSNNSIIVKWRTTEPLNHNGSGSQDSNNESPVQVAGTWVSTTTFTCVVPSSVAVGHEVEVMSGDNAGCSFKISNLSGTPDGTTTLTVTISEAAPTSSTQGALFRFDNWTSETAITSTTIGNKFVPFTSISNGEFLQLKIELRGFSQEIDELIPVYRVNTTIETNKNQS